MEFFPYFFTGILVPLLPALAWRWIHPRTRRYCRFLGEHGAAELCLSFGNDAPHTTAHLLFHDADYVFGRSKEQGFEGVPFFGTFTKFEWVQKEDLSQSLCTLKSRHWLDGGMKNPYHRHCFTIAVMEAFFDYKQPLALERIRKNLPILFPIRGKHKGREYREVRLVGHQIEFIDEEGVISEFPLKELREIEILNGSLTFKNKSSTIFESHNITMPFHILANVFLLEDICSELQDQS